MLRTNEKLLNKLDFIDKIKYQDKVNAIIQYIENDMSINEYNLWKNNFKTIPNFLSKSDKNELIKTNNLSLSSDGFFPFRDNIDQSSLLNIEYIVQPGGSVIDKSVIDAR